MADAVRVPTSIAPLRDAIGLSFHRAPDRGDPRARIDGLSMAARRRLGSGPSLSATASRPQTPSAVCLGARRW